MSAVGASAYRSGEVLKNEYDGITHDFTRKRGIVHTEIGSGTMLRPKAWKAEVADLTAQKDHLYLEVRRLKEEVAEAETVKRCVEQAIPPTKQRKEKSKTHDVSL